MASEAKYVIFKEFPNGLIRQVNMKPLDSIPEAEKVAEELAQATGMPHYWMEMPPEKQSLYPIRNEAKSSDKV